VGPAPPVDPNLLFELVLTFGQSGRVVEVFHAFGAIDVDDAEFEAGAGTSCFVAEILTVSLKPPEHIFWYRPVVRDATPARACATRPKSSAPETSLCDRVQFPAIMLGRAFCVKTRA
jgi:hypothetical protein